MSATTLPRGVDRHGNRFRGRVRGFPPETFDTVDEAEDYVRECRRRKRNGILVPPSRRELQAKITREVAGEVLARLETVGGRQRRPYSQDGMDEARKAARPWTGPREDGSGGLPASAPSATDGNGVPFYGLPFAALRPVDVELYLEARQAQAPRMARGESQFLTKLLDLADRRGYQHDSLLRALEPIRTPARDRMPITYAELIEMSVHADECIRRIYPLGGSLGGRISELLNSDESWLDLKAGTLTIPAWACKERRAKVIDLLPEEITYLREQLLARARGTTLLFPRRDGQRWKHNAFFDAVVMPTRRKAAKAWRQRNGAAEHAPTPFEQVVFGPDGQPERLKKGNRIKTTGFAPHDLRRSASDLLMELNVPLDVAAARLGHKDGGYLLVTRYASKQRRKRVRQEIDRIAAAGGIQAALRAAGAAS